MVNSGDKFTTKHRIHRVVLRQIANWLKNVLFEYLLHSLQDAVRVFWSCSIVRLMSLDGKTPATFTSIWFAWQKEPLIPKWKVSPHMTKVTRSWTQHVRERHLTKPPSVSDPVRKSFSHCAAESYIENILTSVVLSVSVRFAALGEGIISNATLESFLLPTLEFSSISQWRHQPWQ